MDGNGYLAITYTDWTGDADDVALLTELAAEAEAYRDATAYAQALQSISTLGDALDDLRRREYADYAARLTAAVKAKLAALELTILLTFTITPAPETWEREEFDTHAPPPYPRTAIEGAVESAVMETPTPTALPGTPLDRLGRVGKVSS